MISLRPLLGEISDLRKRTSGKLEKLNGARKVFDMAVAKVTADAGPSYANAGTGGDTL